MTNSTLETTETEYLIRFSINKFDLDFVQSIFNFINTKKTAIKEASQNWNVKDADDERFYKENYFSHLDEK